MFVDFDHGLNNAVARIREVLDDSSDTPRYIETLPRRGYRFIAPLAGVAPAVVPSDSGQRLATVETPRHSSIPEPSVPSRSRIFSARKSVLIWGAVALVLAGIALFLYRSSAGHGEQPVVRSLAVLPLKNLSGDPAQEYFADGMTEEIIGRLAVIRGLRVVSRTSVMHFKNTNESVSEIAKTLGADAIVEGSVMREGDRIRIHAQLIRGATDEHFWSETYDRELGDVLTLESEIAQAIADKVEVTVSSQERSRLAAVRQVSPDVYESYLKGRYYWNTRTADGLQRASIYFQEAIDKDPFYAAAYSGLADCNSGLAWHGFRSPADALPKAQAAALKATELDPQSAEAHASLGLVLHHRWDWSRAEFEFKRAIELDSRYANAHHWYGDFLSVHGRHDEAIFEAKEAVELDPLNRMIGTWLALRYYLARQYDLATQQSRDTVELDTSFGAAHLLLGRSYLQTGLYDQGLAELQRAAELSGNSPIYLAQVGVAYAMLGRKAEALRTVGELQKISKERYVSPYGIAQIYAALNDKEQTFKWLEIAFKDRAVWMSYLAVDPVFDSVHSDQRFQDLLKLVGLDKAK
jgi:TolB-like protein/Flp pilus assembly protein TadD